MLKKSRRNFFFLSRKEQSRSCNFIKYTGILLRVGALLFLFCIFTDRKWQSRMFETGSVGLAEAQLFFLRLIDA